MWLQEVEDIHWSHIVFGMHVLVSQFPGLLDRLKSHSHGGCVSFFCWLTSLEVPIPSPAFSRELSLDVCSCGKSTRRRIQRENAGWERAFKGANSWVLSYSPWNFMPAMSMCRVREPESGVATCWGKRQPWGRFLSPIEILYTCWIFDKSRWFAVQNGTLARTDVIFLVCTELASSAWWIIFPAI